LYDISTPANYNATPKLVKIIFQKIMNNQIFVAVADGFQREWTEKEKELISQNPELVNQLEGWLENSLSDGCWHSENYHFIRGLNNSSSPETRSFFDEPIDIPF
jgi:hypothetical protein